MKKYRNCQSCGMPLRQDTGNGGTKFDGTKHHKYCSACYQNGLFTQPTLTVEEMQNLVKEHLKKMGYPGLLIKYFTRGIEKLERWS
jgi:hypothetical protein